MDRITELTLDFFDSRRRNFWHWAENGEVLEWQFGGTLCYTTDLLDILRGFSGRGVPHIGAVILSLESCKENTEEISSVRGSLFRQMRRYDDSSKYSSTHDKAKLMDDAFKTLDTIRGVAKEFRSGTMRIHLLRAIFEDLPDNLVAIKDIDPVIDRFKGIMAQEGYTAFYISTPINLALELEALQNSPWRQKGSAALEQYLLTNLSKIPQPADIQPLPEPETESLHLIDELLKDEKTEGLARLTQRLLAAIRIPATTKGSSDQPFGGFSDITNRGNLDRLLLSELAQDDDTLTARLVNNEALYLRREEPPTDIERERTVLLDTTIQMWGYPRVFALAAALACAEKKQHISRINAFLLRGKEIEAMDLTTKKGVVDALGQLDFHLHCGIALNEFLLNVRASATHDIVFVTNAETLKTPDFQSFFAENKRFLTYLIVVNRVGDLQVFDLSGGRNKLLGTSKFDLQDLLFPSKKKPNNKSTEGSFQPVFYEQKPLPLYYLPTGAVFKRPHFFEHPSVGVVNITDTQRVLRWRSPGFGAEELLSFIEDGDYCIGFGNMTMLYIMVSNRNTRLFKFYKIDIRSGWTESHDFTGEAFATIDQIAFDKSHFYLKNNQTLDCRDAVFSMDSPIIFNAAQVKYLLEKRKISIKRTKLFIKNRYCPIQSPKSIFISNSAELIIDRYGIYGNLDLSFYEASPILHSMESEEEQKLTVSTPFGNPSLLFYEKRWRDGSVAAIDSRGFLHLKSSHPKIPEITIVLNLGGKTAAWASDGKYCGVSYFLNVQTQEKVTEVYFYKNYIKRFVYRILKL